jgi:hypothetical protein
MPERKDLILKRLTEEGAKTAAFFKGLAASQWGQQVYTTGPEWGAHDLLIHFISAERTLALYYQDMIDGGPGVPRDFDIDAFNAREVAALKAAPHSPDSLIAEFERQRAQTTDLVQKMAEADFDRVGYHPWFGDTPLENMLKLVYRHNMIHQRDIEKALATGQPVPHLEVTAPSKQS